MSEKIDHLAAVALQAKIEEIGRLVSQGKTIDEIAAEFNRSKLGIYQILKAAGKKIVTLKALVDSTERKNVDLMDRIDVLLKNGYSMSKIAKIVGVSINGIYNAISIGGKQIIATGTKLVDIDDLNKEGGD